MNKKLLFTLSLGVIITILYLIQIPTDQHYSADKRIIIQTYKDDENLISLRIIDKKHNANEIKRTNASAYQRFEITFWGNDNFLFDSSDIGSALFSYKNDEWYGMNVLSYSSPTKKFRVVLLPQKEKMKQADGINKAGNELKDNRFSFEDQYELLVFTHQNSTPLKASEKYYFSINDFPENAIKWIKENEFILAEKEYFIHFIINYDKKILFIKDKTKKDT